MKGLFTSYSKCFPYRNVIQIQWREGGQWSTRLILIVDDGKHPTPTSVVPTISCLQCAVSLGLSSICWLICLVFRKHLPHVFLLAAVYFCHEWWDTFNGIMMGHAAPDHETHTISFIWWGLLFAPDICSSSWCIIVLNVFGCRAESISQHMLQLNSNMIQL